MGSSFESDSFPGLCVCVTGFRLNEIESAWPPPEVGRSLALLTRPRPRPAMQAGSQERQWSRSSWSGSAWKACKQSQDEARPGKDAEPSHELAKHRRPSPSNRKDSRSQLSGALSPKSSLSHRNAQLCVGVANSWCQPALSQRPLSWPNSLTWLRHWAKFDAPNMNLVLFC